MSIVGKIYSLWISGYIGKVGKGCSFGRHLKLQGGGNKDILIGDNTRFGEHCILGCWKVYKDQTFPTSKISIGNDCNIGDYTQITSISSITISDGLLTGRFVYIGDNSHGGTTTEDAILKPSDRKLKTKGGIFIGKNVWIGDKVTILGGVTIGDNVIIGANSVVTHDVESNTVVGGIPAHVITVLA